MWPFSKKRDQDDSAAEQGVSSDAPVAEEVSAPSQESAAPVVRESDAADFGPFDGDTVNIDEFDFGDFATGVLDLGSMRIPMPNPSEIQVEMGEDGPRMLHIVTEHGRITPVAFASSRSGGVWGESVDEIVAGMEADGLNVTKEPGPWGDEVLGTTEHAAIRILGVDGPRWTLRMTLASPRDRADELAALGREVTARTFVYRGETPMLSGNVLPVAMPAQLVDQIQQAMAARAAESMIAQPEQQEPAADQQAAAPAQQPSGETAEAPAEQAPLDSAPLDSAPLDEGSALQQMRRNSQDNAQ